MNLAFRIRSGVLTAATLVGAVLAPAPALAANETVTLEPTIGWNVDWAENYCTLQRTFGTKEAPLLLRINSFEPGYRFEFLIAGEQTRRFRYPEGFELSLGEVAPIKIQRPNLAENENFGPGFIFTRNIRAANQPTSDARQAPQDEPIPLADTAFDAKLRDLTLSGHGHELRLHTGAMAAGLKALRGCVDNLVRSWGIDPAVQAGLTRKPEPMHGNRMAERIAGGYHVPQGRMRGVIWLRLLAIIDASGKPTSCRIQNRSADTNEAGNNLPCDVVMDSRFTPALDAEGQPVAAFYQATVYVRQG